ncbi:hypothetical protein [Rhodococcus sp. NPDC059234]|uniref:hypothetical protein n=1 Tax=Rhodococcus sp. NPDC059234 TaxID=3346781 RepID=UPI00366E5B83
MDTTRPSPNTVLVVRAWMESDHATGFRARLLGVDAYGATSSMIVANPAQVLEAVRSWLDDIIQHDSA